MHPARVLKNQGSRLFLLFSGQGAVLFGQFLIWDILVIWWLTQSGSMEGVLERSGMPGRFGGRHKHAAWKAPYACFPV
ncbi:hypothetical protein ACFX2F_002180 [Malus domestica]